MIIFLALVLIILMILIGGERGAVSLMTLAEMCIRDRDLTLSVEIRDKIYVYSQTIKGAGGMPIGTNGKAMLLLSGGIDSPVAGYMIAKRGVKIDAVYFHAPPYTSERAKQKVVDLAKQVAKYLYLIHI